MILQENERIDKIGFGGFELIQDVKEFCYGIDAVLLADFAASVSRKNKRIFDLGTGTGIIPLILSHKLPNCHVTGVEIQEASAKRAKRNICFNGLEDRIDILNCDIINMPKSYREAADVVVSNPPYMEKGGAIVSTGDAKAIARHETTAGLKDFFEAASKLLGKGGEFFMVHRPARLSDIFCYSREAGFEAKTMRLVSPKEGAAPNIVLMHFVKGAGKELKVLKALNVYEEDGRYTEEIMRIYERDK